MTGVQTCALPISLKIQQIESLDEVKLYYDSIKNNMYGISIPIEIKTVSCNDSLWVSRAYNYASDESCENLWRGTPLKIRINNEYVISVSHYPNQPDTCYYIFLSKYYLSPESDLQDSLSQYIDKMKNEKLGSLSVGTLQEFKKKHPVLVDRILRNDSIGFDVRNNQERFVEFISFPVEY